MKIDKILYYLSLIILAISVGLRFTVFIGYAIFPTILGIALFFIGFMFYLKNEKLKESLY